MQAISQLETHRADARQIVQDVFQSMLGLAVEPATATRPADWSLVTAIVHFTGKWKGAALLECSAAQAFVLTARLMGIPAVATMNDDVRDALGELTNMIAGNLKSVLTPGVSLSTPSVVEGSDYCLRICGDNIVSRLAFNAGDGPFWLALIETVTPDSATLTELSDVPSVNGRGQTGDGERTTMR